MRIHLLFFTAFFCLLSFRVFAQPESTDAQLAQLYFNNGEYEKAKGYYEKLVQSQPSKINHLRYFECLVQIKDSKSAEKLAKKLIAKYPADLDYSFLLADFYEKNEQEKEANKIYDGLVQNMDMNPSNIIVLFEQFRTKQKNDYALKTIEKGRKYYKDSYPFQFQFAELYANQGQTDKMMDEYLSILDVYPSYLENLKFILSKQIDFNNAESKENQLLKRALIDRVQKNPDDRNYLDMLIWYFIQCKNFNGAYVQLVAIDKRLNLLGIDLLDFGRICLENKSYDVAKKSFQYIVDLGEDKPNYYAAENLFFSASFSELTNQKKYTTEEIKQLIGLYNIAYKRRQNKRNAATLLLEMTYIQAFYGQQTALAIETLQEALQNNVFSDIDKAKVKLQLADIHVLHGDMWEASLLYMQIDTDFKFESIGQEAKFKNARIFYYDGEFDFAQSQLDVLKQSTSKVIANDAMNLSILITDNFGLDSNFQAMYWFSQGDLLVEQHRYEEAFVLFDSIIKKYPAHSLGDEILIKKARAMELQGDWNQELAYLNELLKYYNKDILADDALFMMANLYENGLNNQEKALETYKKIIFEFPGSFYVTESRQKVRSMRGDLIKENE